MSASAALAIAKLMYPQYPQFFGLSIPETKITKADSKAIKNFPKRYY
jgi:hypothetical protein